MMRYEFDMYYKNNFLIPGLLAIVFFLLLLADVILVIQHRDQFQNFDLKSKLSYHVASGIVSIIMLTIMLFTLRQSVYLIKEQENDAISIIGVVTDIKSVSNSPRYYINGKACHADWILIDGEKYYIIASHYIEPGDEIELTYLPKSRFVIAYQKSS